MEKKLHEKMQMLPSVDLVLNSPDLLDFGGHLPHKILADAARQAVEAARRDVIDGQTFKDRDEALAFVVEEAVVIAKKIAEPSLKTVINATGILLHTNLGRALLSDAAVEAMINAAKSYTNLEFDIQEGHRGSRHTHLKSILKELTGAEDVLVVNNNAGAVLLLLDTLAKGKEVIISRGELIEIGGSFRLPDILKKSGAILREVGCTNRTHPHDYEDGINENTALLMKSHTSNYALRGFTKEVSGSEVAEIAHRHGLFAIEDMGSGLLIDLGKYGLYNEPTVEQVVKSGIDAVTFSGDKLLGGPQAGVVLASKELIQKMAENPLTRALRPDKLTIAALEATLNLYRNPDELEKRLPFLKMLAQNREHIELRAVKIMNAVQEKTGMSGIFSIEAGYSMTGGGAFPDTGVKTRLMAIDVPGISPDELQRRLLDNDLPVVTRIHNGKLVMDLRTVLESQDGALTAAIESTVA